jgi:hypothetical protein
MWATVTSSLSLLYRAQLPFYLCAVTLYVLSILLMAWRWRAILGALGCKVRLRDTTLANLSFLFVNNVTPGRVGGEVLRVAVLRQQAEVDLKAAVASSFYDRIVDVAQIPLFLLLALPALAVLRQRLTGSLGTLALVLGAGLATAVLLGRTARLRGLIASLRSRFESVVLPRQALLMALGYSTLVALGDALRLTLVARACGVHLTLWQACALSVVATASGGVPLMGGLGFVEGGLTATLCLFQVPVETALAIALLERSISYAFATSLGGLASLLLGGHHVWRRVRTPPAQ